MAAKMIHKLNPHKKVVIEIVSKILIHTYMLIQLISECPMN